MYYLQEDLGDISLLHSLEASGYNEDNYNLFKKSLEALASLQVSGDKGLDYDRCLTNAEFGKQAIMADLLYFKYYFLDALRKPYDKQKLIDDFEALSNYLTHTEYKYFHVPRFSKPEHHDQRRPVRSFHRLPGRDEGRAAIRCGIDALAGKGQPPGNLEDPPAE
jgi:hypothetical protein